MTAGSRRSASEIKAEGPRIYTLGPFRAPTEYVRRRHIARAERLALQIAEFGGLYYCPHLHSCHFDGLLTDEYWLRLALDMLRQCDAAALVGPPDDILEPHQPEDDRYPRIYLDPSSAHASHGSIAEAQVCRKLGIPVLVNLQEVRLFTGICLGTGETWRFRSTWAWPV